jgi:hypothetical protein
MKLILVALLACSISTAYDCGSNPLCIPDGLKYVTSDANQVRTCSNALDACTDVITAQDQDIAILKQDVKALEAQVVKEEDTSHIPTWTYILLGVVAGGVGTKLLLK